MTNSTAVLVYGDDPLGRRTLRNQLVSEGHNVLVASSSAEAAKALKSASGVRIAVLHLRDEASTIRVIEQLRELNASIRIVVVGHEAEIVGVECIPDVATEKALHEIVQRLSDTTGNAAQASSA